VNVVRDPGGLKLRTVALLAGTDPHALLVEGHFAFVHDSHIRVVKHIPVTLRIHIDPFALLLCLLVVTLSSREVDVLYKGVRVAGLRDVAELLV
jgi:hypothetical protein